MTGINVVKYTFTQPVRPLTYCVTKDTIVVDKAGAIHVIKAGTLITLPEPDGPLKVESRLE